MAEKEDNPRPDLESIAKNLANLNENHQIDQIMPSVVDAFHSAKGVKQISEDGVITYKTKFNEKEAESIADSVYDALTHHMRRTYNGLSKENFDKLKDIKDKHGYSMLDNHVSVYFNISRQELRSSFAANKDKLSHNTVMKMMEEPIKHNSNYHFKHTIKDLKPKHMEHIKEFINHNVKTHGLPQDQYNVKDAYSIQDVLPAFQDIAASHYKHHKKEEK